MNKEYRINETLAILKNDISRKALTVAQYTTSIDYDNTVEIFYENLNMVEDFIMLSANKQKIQVEGIVCKYNNPLITKPCIVANSIKLL